MFTGLRDPVNDLIKTSEVMLTTLFIFEEKRIQKIDLLPTHVTLDVCRKSGTPVPRIQVGYANKSVWWMPWH